MHVPRRRRDDAVLTTADDGSEPALEPYVEVAGRLDPFDGLGALRSACRVHAVADHDPPFVVLTRFADVAEMLRRPGEWRNHAGPGVLRQDAGVLGSTDDPDHARHRRALRAAFLPSAIARLEPRVAAIADDLIDDLAPRGGGDFVARFAAPFPAMVIGELLGVRPESIDQFRAASQDVIAGLGSGDRALYEAAKTAISDCIEAEVVDRQAVMTTTEPAPDGSDDVCTLLAKAERAGDLDRTEVRHLGYQLLVAGHETTTNLLGMMLLRLVERPDVLARLRAEPELVPATVEEALRFDSPVQGLFRTNDTACTLAGLPLAADTKVQMQFASANHDDAAFSAPDEFLLDRDESELRRHLAFGWGIHLCLGAPLARLEGRLALERVLRRMGDIELTSPPAHLQSFVFRGLRTLPLRWTPLT